MENASIISIFFLLLLVFIDLTETRIFKEAKDLCSTDCCSCIVIDGDVCACGLCRVKMKREKKKKKRKTFQYQQRTIWSRVAVFLVKWLAFKEKWPQSKQKRNELVHIYAIRSDAHCVDSIHHSTYIESRTVTERNSNKQCSNASWN